MDRLQKLYELALGHYGMWYQWGGEGPPRNYGYDCSGFVQRILREGKCDPPGDQTAQTLYDWAKKNKWSEYRGRGSVAFFGFDDKISHVGWMIDSFIMISAAGGTSYVTNMDKARQKDAFIKIQPISWYKAPKFIAAFAPPYRWG